MQSQGPADQPKDLFPVVIFSVALLSGIVVGYQLTGYLSPESGMVFKLFGALLPPFGLILGLSLAEGVDGVLALLRVFSVLDGRHTFAEILALGGKPRQSILVFPTMMAASSAGICIVGSVPIHMFTKPEMVLLDFASYYGMAGLGFGIAMALLLRFLTAEE